MDSPQARHPTPRRPSSPPWIPHAPRICTIAATLRFQTAAATPPFPPPHRYPPPPSPLPVPERWVVQDPRASGLPLTRAPAASKLPQIGLPGGVSLHSSFPCACPPARSRAGSSGGARPAACGRAVLCGGMPGGARGRWQGKLNPSSVVSDIIDSEADNKFSVPTLSSKRST
ncbi:hypothetical protein PVAP13_2KG243600 [Panicum virgatum]|uniref:Uncharacterized protein n=1 Tax=Panicum virgatum TaxID=38727 RepID=A0A8T0W2A9_PANVG|nr:hypothetical protein PVAP13_2KG243600 [Panicum virgatum]